MPWTATDTIPAIRGKSLKTRQTFAETANAVLAKGRSDEEAITAGLSAVAKYERELMKTNHKVQPKPSHLQAILDIAKAAPKTKELLPAPLVTNQGISPEFLPKGQLPANVQRNITGINFNSKGQLVVTFDTGEKIETDSVDTLNVHTTVAVGGPSSSSSSDDSYESKYDEASSTISYWGRALVGSGESDSVWKIQRITISGASVITEWADGNANYDNAWSDRAILSYS